MKWLGQKPAIKLSPSFSSFLETTRLSSSMKSTSKISPKSVHFYPFPNATIILQAVTIQVHHHMTVPSQASLPLSPPPTNPPSFLQIHPSFRPNLAPSLCFLKPFHPPHHSPKKLNSAVRVSDDLISASSQPFRLHSLPRCPSHILRTNHSLFSEYAIVLTIFA